MIFPTLIAARPSPWGEEFGVAVTMFEIQRRPSLRCVCELPARWEKICANPGRRDSCLNGPV